MPGRDLVATLMGLGVLWLGLSAWTPPSVTNVTGEFSAKNAWPDLELISAQPHPTGSLALARLHAWLQGELEAAGLGVEVHEGTEVRQSWAGTWVGAPTLNRVATLPGSAPTGVVALMVHTDSVPTGPGAGDDGAAVAALLSVARVLAADPPLANTVRLVFTDGEELGLFGARLLEREGFFDDVDAVINVEGRGNAGPALLFETGEGSNALISAFARLPHPMGSSLAPEVYRRMPNDTDFTIPRELGLPGLNFAHLSNFGSYHAPHDDPAHLDPRTLQQQGEILLGMARSLGSMDLARVGRPGRDVFFHLPGGLVPRYSEAWAIPLAMAGVILLVLAGLRQHRTRDLARGALNGGLALVGSGLSGALVLAALVYLHPEGGGIRAPVVGGRGWGVGATSGRGVAIAALIAGWGAGSERCPAVSIGILGLPAILSVAIAVLAPGASYLLGWPLLFVAVGHLFPGRIAALLASIPALVILPPVAVQLVDALGLPGLVVVGILAGVVTLCVAPLWSQGRVPVAAGLVALGIGVVGGAASAGFTADHPQQDGVTLEQLGGETRLLTTDRRSSPFTRQWFDFDQPVDSSGGRTVGFPMEALPAPELVVAERAALEGGHELRGLFRGVRGGAALELRTSEASRIRSLSVSGEGIEPSGSAFRLLLSNPVGGVVPFHLVVEGDLPLEVTIWEISFDLPFERPLGTEPGPFWLGGTDQTRVGVRASL